MELRKTAEKLGLLEIIKLDTVQIHLEQEEYFDFLLVLDFESTCWESKNNFSRKPEIIEFSVVLYDVLLKKVVSKFQQYVAPTENPILSDFCIKFTGITQEKLSNGTPLSDCLALFMNWIKDISVLYDFKLPKEQKLLPVKKGAFVTWSDWDLGTCLKSECRRKSIMKLDIFNCWIDLRLIYREFYKRRPQGLSGALSEVGLKFNGKEHSGIDDAYNTAMLVGRMIQDGVKLYITKHLD